MLSDACARLFVEHTAPNQLINNSMREFIISVRRSDQNATMERPWSRTAQSTTASEKTTSQRQAAVSAGKSWVFCRMRLKRRLRNVDYIAIADVKGLGIFAL